MREGREGGWGGEREGGRREREGEGGRHGWRVREGEGRERGEGGEGRVNFFNNRDSYH